MGLSSCIIILSFLFGTIATKEHRTYQFGQCELSGVSFRELRDSFEEIKETVQSQDNKTDVKLLKESVLLDVPVPERCCLLRHLLKFYIDHVFKHYEAMSNLHRRRISALANMFLSIKATLRQCHAQNKCPCGEESHRRYKIVLNEYGKLDRNITAIKALGEMDILLAWMRDINN